MPETKIVHVLLFSEQGLSFGIYAHQVEALLNVETLYMGDSPDSERHVLYKGKELRVIRLSRRLKLQEALEENRKFLSCQNVKDSIEARMDRGKESADLVPPARILVTRHDEGEVGILVECLKQLQVVPLSRIFRLPILMERKQLFQYVWGLALIDEQPTVLIDLEHI